jgi:hypothetical protein
VPGDQDPGITDSPDAGNQTKSHLAPTAVACLSRATMASLYARRKAIGIQGETWGVLTESALVLSLAVAKKETECPKKLMRTVESVQPPLGLK